MLLTHSHLIEWDRSAVIHGPAVLFVHGTPHVNIFVQHLHILRMAEIQSHIMTSLGCRILERMSYNDVTVESGRSLFSSENQLFKPLKEHRQV